MKKSELPKLTFVLLFLFIIATPIAAQTNELSSANEGISTERLARI